VSAQREIIDSLSFDTVWQSLGGGALQGRGENRRARAFWRNGDGLSVAVDLRTKVWRDHVSGDGGGMVDLVMVAHSCDRGTAWGWLSELSGIPLRQVSREESERYRRAMELSQTEAKQLYREWAAAVDAHCAYTNRWFRTYHALRDVFWNDPTLTTVERAWVKTEIEFAWWWYSILRHQQDSLMGADPKKLVKILRQTAKRRAA
jgi:hypothetical protein